jgi:hypothetical protein
MAEDNLGVFAVRPSTLMPRDAIFAALLHARRPA